MAAPTAEDFQRAFAEMQGLTQRVNQLTQELQISRQRESMLESRIEQGANVTELVRTIADGQTRMTEELVRSRGKELTLVDNRGVAKPEKFKGDEGSYIQWKTKTESFIFSVFPELERPLAWAEVQEAPISMAQIRAEFGPGGAQEEVDGLENKIAQVYAVLQNLLEDEPFSIIRNILKGNGLEGWRKLAKRYDPATGARKKSLLKHILTPERQKLSDLSAYLEQWMELVRRYEDRRGSGGRNELPDDIKISILESICPVELEKHLQLNRQRLDTFEDVYEEIASYLETRVGIKLKIGSGHATSSGDPMDVGSFHKGGKGGKKGGKGKGKGKDGKSPKGHPKGGGKSKGPDKDKCHICGRSGHWANECWHKDKSWNKGQKDRTRKGSGKTGGKKKGQGKAKGANSVEHADEGYDDEEPKQEPEAETGFLQLATLEREESESQRVSGSERRESERRVGANPQPASAAESSSLGRRASVVDRSSPLRPVASMAESDDEMEEVEIESPRGRSPVRKGGAKGKGTATEKAKSKPKSVTRESRAVSAPAIPVAAPKLEGIPERIRKLAEDRANRMVTEGAEERDDWREQPTTNYRQRLMAAREASRGLKGSVAQAVYRNTLKATTGLDEACSSCDDRQKRAKSIVRAFAKASVCKIRERLAARRRQEEEREVKKAKKPAVEEESDQESLYSCEDDLEEVEQGAEADNEETSDQEADDVATTLAQELSPAEDPSDPEEVKPENIPEQRNVGTSSSVLMHRVVESLELGRLCKRRDELQLQAEAAEDPDTHDRAEEELQRVLDRIKVLKGYIKSNDQNKPARLSEANRTDKSFHDIRYYKAIESGVHPRVAWKQEKKRRRATLFRMKTAAEGAEKRKELEARWVEQFRQKGTAGDDDYEDADNEKLDAEGIETEVLLPGASSTSVRVAKGAKAEAKKRVRKALTKEELEKFREELKEDELALLNKPRSTAPKDPKQTQRSAEAHARRREKFRRKQREKRRQLKAESKDKGRQPPEETPLAVSAEEAPPVKPKGKSKEKPAEPKDTAKAIAKPATKAMPKALRINPVPMVPAKARATPTVEDLEREREENRKRKLAAYEEKQKKDSEAKAAKAKAREERVKESQEILRKQLEARRARNRGKGSGESASTMTTSVRQLVPKTMAPAPKTPPSGKGTSTSSVRRLTPPPPKTSPPPPKTSDAISSAPWRARSRSPSRKGTSKGKDTEKGKKGKGKNSPRDINSLGHGTHEINEVVTWNLDTGAAASVMPSSLAKQFGEPVGGEEVKFKTASGELLNSQGKVHVKGLNEAYRKVALTAHVADVHRPLAAGSSVGKHNLIVLDENGGVLVHKGTSSYNRLLKVLEEEKEKENKHGRSGDFFTPVHQERGVYVFRQWAEKPRSPFAGPPQV